MKTGSSKPNLERRAASASALPASASIAATGSPGTRRSMKKTSVATAHITRTVPIRRLRRYPLTGLPCSARASRERDAVEVVQTGDAAFGREIHRLVPHLHVDRVIQEAAG